jgi:hypothetical protein
MIEAAMIVGRLRQILVRSSLCLSLDAPITASYNFTKLISQNSLT